ncbi:MAG: hypothetical protein IPN79_17010 [Saprospiraceae bacterium]|nr:hypothetical protein [Saprospiraceae bacterium]
MKVLKNAMTGNYTTGEIIQFSTNVSYVYNESDTEALKLKDRVDALIQATSVLDEVFLTPAGTEKSGDVKQVNIDRRDVMTGLNYYLRSFTKSKDEAKKNAADVLLKNIKTNCKKINSISYQDRTAQVNALHKDWTTETNLKEAIILLGVTERLEELKNLNDEFDALFLSNSRTLKPNSGILEKRAAVLDAYRLLIRDTEAFSFVAEDKTPYQNLIREVNNVITRYNAPVKQRKAIRKSNQKETAGTVLNTKQNNTGSNPKDSEE